jgi:hypothetical protein
MAAQQAGRSSMAVGPSGRIVVEIDPDLKQELYAALEQDGVSLKQWFLERVGEHLKDRGQLSLPLMVSDGDEADRKYR